MIKEGLCQLMLDLQHLLLKSVAMINDKGGLLLIDARSLTLATQISC